jgi:hypothetical protein
MSKSRQWEKSAEALRYRVMASPLTVPTAIEFLESDPWFHGSGYIKANLIKFINRQELKPDWSKRLQKVVLAAVDREDRREFRSYCRLAHKLCSEHLRSELTRRMEVKDEGVSRRARWMLEYLKNDDHAKR